jgi:phospholipase/carboxylesterase
MKLATMAGLTVRITGGSGGEGEGTGPVVVLLHGFGAPGDDLVPLWREIAAPQGTRYVFPEALHDLGPGYEGGRAWWWIDIEQRMRRRALGHPSSIDEVPEGLLEARAKVSALLDEVESALRPPPGKLVLGGFSQGAMLSLDVALHTERALAGLVLLSGTHIAAREWAARLDTRRGVPVFMSHGRDDELLAFGIAEGLRNALVSAGIAVEWVPFRGGHAIPMQVVDGVGAFLRRVLE